MAVLRDNRTFTISLFVLSIEWFKMLILYFLYINFRLAFLQKDITFLSILIVLLMALLTENILNRQNGILFFGLLINYYSFKCLALKKRTS